MLVMGALFRLDLVLIKSLGCLNLATLVALKNSAIELSNRNNAGHPVRQEKLAKP